MEEIPEDNPYLSYTKTPFLKAVPVLLAVPVSGVVGSLLATSVSLWVGIVAFVMLIVLSLLFLRGVLGFEWERILQLREYDEA